VFQNSNPVEKKEGCVNRVSKVALACAVISLSIMAHPQGRESAKLEPSKPSSATQSDVRGPTQPVPITVQLVAPTNQAKNPLLEWIQAWIPLLAFIGIFITAYFTLRRGRMDARYSYASEILKLRLRQVEEFYAPALLYIEQSRGLYEKLRWTIEHERKDLSVPEFRLLDYIYEFKRNETFGPLVDRILAIGKQLTTLISEKSGLIEGGVTPTLVEYQAHFEILAAASEQALNKEQKEGWHKLGYYPRLLNREIREGYKEDETLEQRRAAVQFAAKAAAKIRRSLDKKTPSLKRVKADLRRTLADHIDAVLHDMARPVDEHSLHGYSPAERRELYKWIDSAIDDVPKEVAALTKQLEHLNRSEHKIESELRKVPSDDLLLPLLQDLQEGYKKLADVNHALATLEDSVRITQAQIDELSRKCQQEVNRLASVAAEEGRLHLVPNIRLALEEFKLTLIDRKIRALEQCVTDCFNILCRKKDNMRRISIDAHTFAVTVKDKDGHPIAKGQLSAGEKQVYAISMLWALGKTSNRPLPLIIDTPLARLDRDHRNLLAEHYFPNASHQVLILSTDTEVDEAYFEQLTPAISKAYLLDFDSIERTSTVSEGYFWREKHEAVQAKAH
jgi:hypothetical protein